MTYIVTLDSISVFIDQDEYIVPNSHYNFDEIKQAIKEDDEMLVKNLIDIRNTLIEETNGHISFRKDEIYYKSEKLNGYITKKMIAMKKEGYNIDNLIAFLENMMENPSDRAKSELYEFLEYGKLPITPDGYFIAYKKIRADFKDIYTGKMDNSVGTTVKMPRDKVNDNSNITCSTGLHFASRSYMNHYGSNSGDNIIVALKINPRDVVSIPKDYNNTKGRACKYKVINVLTSKNNNLKVIEDKEYYSHEFETDIDW